MKHPLPDLDSSRAMESGSGASVEMNDPEPSPDLSSRSVPRRKLLARIDEDDLQRIVCIVAPAGYGKSTLLEQWRKESTLPVASLTFDRHDHSFSDIAQRLATSLREAGLIEDGAARRIGTESDPSAASRLATSALAKHSQPCIVMLDQVERLTHDLQHDLVGGLATTIPSTVRLALASRESPRIRIAALRGTGRVLELGTADLSMTENEAHEMFSACGMDVGDRVPTLVESTEGWPLALHLGGLAISAGADPEASGRLAGADHFIADYIRSEVLKSMEPDHRFFLEQSSVLDLMHGPLCDVVLERKGSAALLREIADAIPLVEPVDREATWFRVHRLLLDCLRSDLQVADEPWVRDAHGRAAAWYETEGQLVEAIAHAHACGDEETTGRVVAKALRETFSLGDFDLANHWLGYFDSEAELPKSQPLLGKGALAYSLLGTDAAFRRWRRALDEAADRDGETDPLTYLIRALCRPESLEPMTRDAASCRAGLAATSEWWTAAQLVDGLVALWSGDETGAGHSFVNASAEGLRYGSPIAASVALACRSILAAERADHATSQAHADRAVDTVIRNNLVDLSTSALAFAVGARCAARSGDLVGARELLAAGMSSRSSLSESLRSISILALVETAKAYLAVADIAGARQAMREASALCTSMGDFGALSEELRELNETIAGIPGGTVGASSLTNAELRVLPYLASHLSFPEIGEALYISRHTVKSHAMAIYRKLGASSRSEAVDVARQDGLLGASSTLNPRITSSG